MISLLFQRIAVVFGLLGMGLGCYMGAKHDFTLAPVHAHINLVGWVTMFLAGLFYRDNPVSKSPSAALHLVLAAAGLVLLVSGIAGVVLGKSWAEPVAVAGSLTTIAAMLVFTFNVFVGSSRRHERTMVTRSRHSS